MTTFHFDLVSPEKLLFSGEVEQVDVPGQEGEFGVLAGHAPFIATLKPGVLTIYRDRDGSIRNNDATTLPTEVFWIDLLNPTADEISFVEGRTGLRVPSKDALSELETAYAMASLST